MIKSENSEYRYFDKNGNEITEGCEIKYLHGDKSLERVERVYRTEDGQLGTDATNPAWVDTGRASPCEFGIYPLTAKETEMVEVVKPKELEEGLEEQNKPLYEVAIECEASTHEALTAALSGSQLEELKKEILPTVQQRCEEAGCMNGSVVVEVTISKDGEFFDHDEDVLDLQELHDKYGEHKSVEILLAEASRKCENVSKEGPGKDSLAFEKEQ